MLALLKEEGITLSRVGRALNTREQPVSCGSFIVPVIVVHCHFLIVHFTCGTFSVFICSLFLYTAVHSLTASRYRSRSTRHGSPKCRTAFHYAKDSPWRFGNKAKHTLGANPSSNLPNLLQPKIYSHSNSALRYDGL